MKGKGGSVNMAKNKKIVEQEAKKKFLQQKKEVLKEEMVIEKKNKNEHKSRHVLDRFLPKKE